MSDNAKLAFTEALAEFQANMPAVGKEQKANAGTYSYSYADLTAIHEAALPLLTQQGFAFTAAPTVRDDGAFVLRYALRHKAGHEEGGDYPLPSQANPQQIGSSITYGRRYCFCAITGIAPGGEDDDGARANDAPIAVRDRGRTPGKTTRTKPDGPQDDEWTTATDVAWLEDFRQRLDLCGTKGEVNGLVGEAQEQLKAGKLSPDDARALKAETDARLAELTGVSA